MPKGAKPLIDESMGDLHKEAKKAARNYDAMEKMAAGKPALLAEIKSARKPLDAMLSKAIAVPKSKKLPRTLPDDPVSRAVQIMREATEKAEKPKKPKR